MFNPRSNDGYYQLGLETAKMIREAIMSARGITEDENIKAQKDVKSAGAMKEALPDEVKSDTKP